MEAKIQFEESEQMVAEKYKECTNADEISSFWYKITIIESQWYWVTDSQMEPIVGDWRVKAEETATSTGVFGFLVDVLL